MKCPKCTETMIWLSEYDYEEWAIEGEGIIGMYECWKDECDVEHVYIFTPTDATL